MEEIVENDPENDSNWVVCYDDEKSKKIIENILSKQQELISIDDTKEIMKHFKSLEYEDIKNITMNDNFKLVEIFCKLIENTSDTEYVTEFIKFINVLSEIEGTMKKLVEMESFKWIVPNIFMAPEEEVHNFLTTLILIFTKVNYIPENEMNKLDESFLEGFIEIGLNYLDYSDNKWLHIFYYTLLGYQKHIISPTYSPLLFKLYSIKRAPELGPELISLLNRDKFEYDLLDQCLSLINDFFSYSVEFQVPVFFFTLDIRVLIDVLLRGIHNLEEMDPLRWQYLEVLSTVLQHPEYYELQHKIDDIKNVLHNLTEERSEEKDPRSSTISRGIIKYLTESFTKY